MMTALAQGVTARRLRPFLALAALLVLSLGSATSARAAAADPNGAGPFECSTLSAFTPLTGSNFQGADGDQCDSTGVLGSFDWQTLVANQEFTSGGGGMKVIDDDAQPLSIYGGGSHEFTPDGWDFVDSLGNAKSDLLAAWGYPEEPGDLFLYLAFAATDAPGTVKYGFELNQNSPGETFTNDAGHEVIKRREDDIL